MGSALSPDVVNSAVCVFSILVQIGIIWWKWR